MAKLLKTQALEGSNADTFEPDFAMIVHAGMTAEAGPLYMLATHYDRICTMLDAFNGARQDAEQRHEEFSARDAALAIYRQTANGEAAVSEQENIKQVKKAVRSSEQNARFAELQRMDNKVSLQLQRMFKACDGVRALRQAKRIVHFDVRRDAKTDAVLSVVTRVRTADEISAQVFTLKALSNVTAIDWNTDTPTAEIYTAADKYRATPLAAATNGDAIAPSDIADVVRRVDTSISGLSMAKDGGITPKAREELSALYARLHSMLSAKQRAKALAAFNEGATSEAAA